MNTIRQGDVVFTKVSELPEGAKSIKGKILQESEVTGHHHHFKPTADVGLFQVGETPQGNTITPDFQKYVVVNSIYEMLYHGKGFDPAPAIARTGDHEALKIDQGIYKINIVREYDYESNEVRNVVD